MQTRGSNQADERNVVEHVLVNAELVRLAVDLDLSSDVVVQSVGIFRVCDRDSGQTGVVPLSQPVPRPTHQEPLLGASFQRARRHAGDGAGTITAGLFDAGG